MQENPQPTPRPQHRKPAQRPPRKGRRKLVSEKKQKRAHLLEQKLVWLLKDKYSKLEDLRAEFPEEDFKEILAAAESSLSGAVEAAGKLAHRDRSGDNDEVARVLDSWEAVSVEEIVEDTGLSAWAVRLVLKDFEARGLICKTKDVHAAEEDGGCPASLYSWKR